MDRLSLLYVLRLMTVTKSRLDATEDKGLINQHRQWTSSVALTLITGHSTCRTFDAVPGFYSLCTGRPEYSRGSKTRCAEICQSVAQLIHVKIQP